MTPSDAHRTGTLVTCHSNADFDAFAAMLAAGRLYAPCDLLYPGSQEKNLNKLYETVRGQDDLLEGCSFVDSSSCTFSQYDFLIVVDTRQRSRLHHVWPLLDNPGIRVEAWDHHPDTSDDIHPHMTHYAATGSVTSLLVSRLKEKGLQITPWTATILGMGLYSDTGSFSYSSTKSEDFEAAAWLLRQGMDVNSISDTLAFEMTRTHVQALNSLLESAEIFNFNGEQVVLAETTLEHYLGDFAYLAHRLMEMEKFAVLFAIGRMDDRIQVVARSRSAAINVGAVCSALGGGGHIYAASASIRDKSLSQVHDAILNALYMQQCGDSKAADYMSAPAVGMETGHTLREADELMVHFSLKSIPIFAQGTRRCIGLLDTTTTQRAMSHGLADEKIDDYMIRPVQTLPLTASLRDLTTVIVGARQRLVPIVREDDTVAGVVTRTDLIGIFAAEPGRMDKSEDDNDESGKSREGRSRNVGKALRDQLPAPLLSLLSLASELGRERKTPVYVVGGFVRDLMLKTPNQDIDLVVEGDGLGFAAALAQRLGGRVRVHKKFLTSVVLYPGPNGSEERVDVATARLEYYESPAAMPTVEHSSIKMDLYRRDFTINALAIRLDTQPMGQIVDFFGGQRDLKDKIIRVLHTLSFVEDPTRILRAVRFEQRYLFRLGADTEKLVRNALAMQLLDKLSPARIFHEFEHICSEERALAAFFRLQELGILQKLHPMLILNPSRQRILPRMSKVLAWFKLLFLDEPVRPWFAYFLVLTGSLSYNDSLTCFRRLGLPESLKLTVMQGRERMRAIRPSLRKLFVKRQPRASEVCALLRDLPLECVLYLMAEDSNPEIRRSLSRFITTWKNMTPDVGGNDLKRMGLAPGPAFARILRKLLVAKLDHKADTPPKQFQLAQALVNEELAARMVQEQDELDAAEQQARQMESRGQE